MHKGFQRCVCVCFLYMCKDLLCMLHVFFLIADNVEVRKGVSLSACRERETFERYFAGSVSQLSSGEVEV